MLRHALVEPQVLQQRAAERDVQDLDATAVEVSSFHHQAIDRPGGGLEVVARSFDGVAEAVELPGRPVLAVQWELQEEWRIDRRFLGVFEWYVAAARTAPRRRSV